MTGGNDKNSRSEKSSKKPGRETILSGMQPTGSLHIGNLEGALTNWVRLQESSSFFACIVDLHALTADWKNPKVLKDRIFQMTVDFLAAGLDPDKCAIFVQSEVKEHAELHLIFSMLISVPTLIRLPTYQEKKDTLDSYGFLGYPVLQAADICLYNADKVPVGKDQEKHIWMANDLAKRFNNTYRRVFKEPEALIPEIPLILGADNRKMSKSYDNHIPFEYTEKQTEKRIKSYYTDPEKVRKGDAGHPEGCPVFLMHRVYSGDAENEIAPPCRTGELGCVDCKTLLSRNLNNALVPIRDKRVELLKQPDFVWDVLSVGAGKARARAENVMDKVRAAMKMNYRGKRS
ncbi:MAG: tryptophan--tRNA ligase [candidate division Zixibacteria bacterium]|nr:tryptophan--tRNA ligase [candidate division Zixibacteria bacterium]